MEIVLVFGTLRGNNYSGTYIFIAIILIFMVIYSLSKVNEVTVPTLVNTASLHRDKTMFVCGGEDLKMYKFDYSTGKEIGKCDDFECQLSVLLYV